MAVRKQIYEQGPIRPPSEANSLLIRLTRNCPWNRCRFCPIYKSEKFSRRSLEEIKADIYAVANAVDKVKEISRSKGHGGTINRRTVALVHEEHPELLPVAFWQYQGGETVFLQDADSLLLPVSQLLEILKLLKEKFPGIKRITSYARSRSLVRRSVKELIRLKGAGLNRIHVGLESGNDRVLEYMQKGVTGAQQIEAGLRVKEAGITLSEYVILGLGGTEWWREHALDTAGVLNKINPDFIRVRTLAVPPASPLFELVERGEFKPLSDDEVVKEEALFIDNLEGIESIFYSDHILNLLEEVNGRLPDEKPQMLDVLNRYLNLPQRRRELFRLGRRTGYFRTLSDLDNFSLVSAVESIYRKLKQEGLSVDQYIQQLMLRFI